MHKTRDYIDEHVLLACGYNNNLFWKGIGEQFDAGQSDELVKLMLEELSYLEKQDKPPFNWPSVDKQNMFRLPARDYDDAMQRVRKIRAFLSGITAAK